ncbi:unnamed protein product, partial [Linum tenue]
MATGIPQSFAMAIDEGSKDDPKTTTTPTLTGAETRDGNHTQRVGASSYANAVIGTTAKAITATHRQVWVPVDDHDLIPGDFNGEPALRVSTGFKSKLCEPWQKTLRMNRIKALTDGPWVIFYHYIAVKQWTPKFRVSDPLPRKMIVWVQLPALQVHFYNREVLILIENLIGRTIKLDYHTLNQQRAKFARLAVEVDLSKPLIPRIYLDDEWQRIEYENLSVVCFDCGKIGHASLTCPKYVVVVQYPQVVITGETSQDFGCPTPTSTPESMAGFGPWMLVTKKSKRNSRGNVGKVKEEFVPGR